MNSEDMIRQILEFALELHLFGFGSGDRQRGMLLAVYLQDAEVTHGLAKGPSENEAFSKQCSTSRVPNTRSRAVGK
jgi:hypothetical protein